MILIQKSVGEYIQGHAFSLTRPCLQSIQAVSWLGVFTLVELWHSALLLFKFLLIFLSFYSWSPFSSSLVEGQPCPWCTWLVWPSETQMWGEDFSCVLLYFKWVDGWKGVKMLLLAHKSQVSSYIPSWFIFHNVNMILLLQLGSQEQPRALEQAGPNPSVQGEPPSPLRRAY